VLVIVHAPTFNYILSFATIFCLSGQDLGISYNRVHIYIFTV